MSAFLFLKLKSYMVFILKILPKVKRINYLPLVYNKKLMNFSQIPGNNNTKSRLRNGVKFDRVSHAHLFSGQDGSSSLAMARAYAQYLLCSNKTDQDSCGKCSSCLKNNNLTHPDVHWIFPVTTGSGTNPTSDMFIDQWREFVKESSFPTEFEWVQKLEAENKQLFIGVKEAYELAKKMTLKPYEGSYRVVIIWQADKMHAPTSNKLLKLLEEPPEKTIFILVSSRDNMLLDTIISRVQKTKIIALTDIELQTFLKDHFELDNQKIENIKVISSGNVAKAIQMANTDSRHDHLTQLFQKWMRICYTAKIPDLSNWIDQFIKHGREEQKEFLVYSLHMIRECLIFNFGPQNLQRTREEEKTFIRKFAPFINENNSQKIIDELEKALNHIARNGSSKIILMDLSLKMVILLRVKSVNLSKPINQ